MKRLLVVLTCTAALGLCGCTPRTATVSTDMADQQASVSKPPDTHEVTEGRAALEVPNDWDVSNDPGLESTVLHAPYHATGSLICGDASASESSFVESHDKFVYELERDGTEIVRDVCEDDGNTVRISLVYIDGETECWQNGIVSDGIQATFIGFLGTDCTDAQKAEFAWVADSLRLVSSKSE